MITALSLSAAAQAAIPAPAERLVMAEAGKRAVAQPAQPAPRKDEAAAKPREAKPSPAGKGEFDYTLYWYN